MALKKAVKLCPWHLELLLQSSLVHMGLERVSVN